MSYKIDILNAPEIPSLLTLLRKNLKNYITVEEAVSQGFLTFEYSPQEINSMLSDMLQPVARVKETSIGAYALAASKSMCLGNDLLRPAVELTDTLSFNNKLLSNQKYYVMGQICVGEELRGQGVFDALYHKHKELYSEKFDCIVTEISTSNLRSLSAHKRVGFEIIHHYTGLGTDWAIVVWDWK